METLTFLEKQALERILGMSGGYVLNFTDRTFKEFFHGVVDINIYEERFAYGKTGSKANYMRGFWKAGAADEVLRLLKGLVECWDEVFSSFDNSGVEKKEELTRIAAAVEVRGYPRSPSAA